MTQQTQPNIDVRAVIGRYQSALAAAQEQAIIAQVTAETALKMVEERDAEIAKLKAELGGEKNTVKAA